MFKSILYLLVLGFVGMMVLSVLFGVLAPLIGFAIKLAIIMVVGYFLLRIFSPKKANEVREKLRRVK
ncbi:MAG: hypothetical protein ABFS14_11610 [Gemmatimonadota bacterium]